MFAELLLVFGEVYDAGHGFDAVGEAAVLAEDVPPALVFAAGLAGFGGF